MRAAFSFALTLGAAASLAACGGLQSPSGAGPVMPQGHAIGTHGGPSRSWMRPDAKAHDLLYVSNDGNNTVTVYSFRPTALVGTLTGFDIPYGLCVDNKQNIYVADYGSGNVYEYAHGGTSRIKTISISAGLPYGCSVDPTTGNLAVLSTGGGVLVFPNGSGSPTTYKNSNFADYYYPSYDDQGNLFVDGVNTKFGPAFGELPKGGSTLESVTLNQTIYQNAGIQWDGKYLAVLDNGLQGNRIYQFSISASAGTLEGTTVLTGTKAVQQFWVPKFGNGNVNPQGKWVAGADSYNSNAPYFAYPSGGSALKTITDSISTPWGVTVSKARK